MRFSSLILICCLCATGFAVDKPHSVSKKDRHAAEQEFKRALELEKSGQLEGALQAATHAADLFPDNTAYATGREVLRQRIVSAYLDRGNALAAKGNLAAAAVQFRGALAVDSQNSYLMQRLRDVSAPDDPYRERTLQLLASVDQIDLAPSSGTGSIHVRGDTRALYAQIGRAFGVTFQFDQAMNSRPVRFDLDDVDFYTATRLAGKMTKTFWSPVSKNEAIVANDTQEMRRVYEHNSLRTFYIGNAISQAELTDLQNILRTIFELNFISVEPGHNTLSIRGPRETVEAAASFIDNIMVARPEVLVDVQFMEFDSNRALQYGLNLPTSFQLFSIPSEIRRILGPDAQAVIDQFNRTGTIDPSTIPAADLANLQGSPLLSPFFFFGKGNGLVGFTVAPLTATLSKNYSRSTSLEHVTLRSMDGESATFRVGDRYPVLTGTFTNVTFDSRGTVSGTGSTPQFQYYDLGLTLKVKPHVQVTGDVRLDLEFEVIALGGTVVNGIPDLTNRSFKSNISAKDGEASVITGMITDQELRSLSGYPAIGQVPGLRSVISTNSNQTTHNQILIVVTPRVIRRPLHDQGVNTLWGLSR